MASATVFNEICIYLSIEIGDEIKGKNQEVSPNKGHWIHMFQYLLMADSGLTHPCILLPNYGRFLTDSGSQRVVQKHLSDGLPSIQHSAEFIDFCCVRVRQICAIFFISLSNG